MNNRNKNILIGFFVASAFAVVVLVLMFLNPCIGDEGKIFRVRFANIDKVTKGTRVTFAGKPVGEVLEIREIPEAVDHRIDQNGFVYAYELEIVVDSSVNVFNSDEISLRTSGLLGEKSVAIIPQPPKPGVPLKDIDDEILYATETGSVEQTFKEFKEIADKFEIVLDQVNEAFSDLKTENTWKRLGESITNLSSLTKKADDSWAKVDESLANIRDITDHIKQGKGTLGALLTKDDLYLRINALLSKANIVMNDINHYGILFHLDKGWQRLRARRMNILQQLQTPQEFRNFFQDEIDEIETALERVSTIVAESPAQIPCLLLDPNFAKTYKELLDRVETLQENIKLVNIQLQEEVEH